MVGNLMAHRLKVVAAVLDVLNILFAERKTQADERLLRAIVNTALVIRCQFTAWDIHRIMKLVALFIRTDYPDSPIGQIKFQLFQTAMLLDSDISNDRHIDRLTALATGMTFSSSL